MKAKRGEVLSRNDIVFYYKRQFLNKYSHFKYTH